VSEAQNGTTAARFIKGTRALRILPPLLLVSLASVSIACSSASNNKPNPAATVAKASTVVAAAAAAPTPSPTPTPTPTPPPTSVLPAYGVCPTGYLVKVTADRVAFDPTEPAYNDTVADRCFVTVTQALKEGAKLAPARTPTPAAARTVPTVSTPTTAIDCRVELDIALVAFFLRSAQFYTTEGDVQLHRPAPGSSGRSPTTIAELVSNLALLDHHIQTDALAPPCDTPLKTLKLATPHAYAAALALQDVIRRGSTETDAADKEFDVANALAKLAETQLDALR
jgi:hypothetical protein